MVETRTDIAVDNTIADLDDARIQERSGQGFARNLWSAVKNGHYSFGLVGVAIAIPLCASIAIAVMPFATAAFAPYVIPAIVGTGALMALEGFGFTGAAAASRANGLAERHVRIMEADVQGKSAIDAAEDKLMESGRNQHFEFPVNRDRGKFFQWKSGLVGAAMGAASGAVLGLGLESLTSISGASVITGAIASAPLLAGLAPAVATVAALALAGAILFGALGLVNFGTDRGVIKSVLNQTEANLSGKLIYKDGPDLGRMQSQESDADLAVHRLRRQAEIDRLEKEYNERIRWGALSGRFRGFAGAVPGELGGLAVGAIAVGAVALFTGAIIASAPFILSACAMGGTLLGMKVFSESGTEAGAEMTSRAIDDEFMRNRALRARGITPPTPQKPKEGWFSPKTALTAGIVGAAIGVALTPALGFGAMAFLAPLAAHATAAAVATFWAHATAVSVIISGIVGASYGLGAKALKAAAEPSDLVYDTFSTAHTHNGPQKAPALRQNALQSACETITPEDMARMNERLAAGNGRNFTQTLTVQQLQAAPAGMQA